MALRIAAMSAMLVCAGCFTVPTPPPVHSTQPVPFQHPGIYVGETNMWTVAYAIGHDGRGLSCLRPIAGQPLFGDIVYDGSRLLTQDGVLEVVKLSDAAMHLSAPHLELDLLKVSE